MAKYNNQGRKYGKKILAVMLAVATVLTTGSINMQALAASYGGMGGNDNSTTISPGNSLGEVITNSGQANPNQKVTDVSFQIWQEALKNYNFQVTLYENPTNSEEPTTGVSRGTFYPEIETTTVDKATSVTVDVSSANIILTEGESLWVVAEYVSGPNDLKYYETTGGTGGKGYRNIGYGWEERDGKNIIKVDTENYTGALNDASVKTFSVKPNKSIISVGDTLTLSSTITPAYKRNVTYTSSDTNVISIDGTTATAENSGTATITAVCEDSTETKTKDIKVVETKHNYPAGKTSYTYDPAGVVPNITVTCGTDTMVLNTDYEIEYAGSYPNVGTATATVKGKAGSSIAGYKSNPISFAISEKPLTASMINKDTIVIDTTNDEFTSATVTDGTYELSTPDDYEVTDITRTSATTTEIKYNITFSGKGNYSGDVTVEKTFASGSTTININSIFDTSKTKITDSERVFQNKNIYIGKNEITFYDKEGNETTFDGDNFDIIQAKNPTDIGTYTITVKGKSTTDTSGNEHGYTGSFTLKYRITRRPLTDGTGGMTITVDPNSYVHDKTAHTPSVTVTYDNGETIDELDSNDYEFTTTDNTDIGEATVVVKGKGNYTGNVTKHFNIIPDFTNDATIVIGGYPATNEGLTDYHTAYPMGNTPTIELYMGNNPNNPDDPSRYKIASSKYNAPVFENTDKAGQAKVTLTGKDEFAGKTVCAYFTIDSKNIKNCNVTVTTPTKQYTGSAVELLDTEYTVYDGATPLTKGEDYNVTYSPNVDAGVVTMNIEGIGNYTGTNTKGKFTITPRPMEDLEVQMGTWNYTGQQIKATPESVTLDGVSVDASNYELSWGENIGPGTGTVILTAKANTSGKTNFTGTKECEFTINPKSLLGATFYVGVDDSSLNKCNATTDPYTYDAAQTFMYTGSEVKPKVRVTDGATTLTPGTDYTVKYSNNTEAGPAFIYITGKGAYAGTTGKITINFTIKKKSIKEDTTFTFNTPKNYEWREINGTKYVFPSVTVTDKATQKTLSEAMRDSTTGEYKKDAQGRYIKDAYGNLADYIIESTATAVGENLTATIKGVNNYDVQGGDVEVGPYTAGKNISDASVSLLLPNGGAVQKTEDVYEVTYIGQNHPDIHVIDGEALAEETDFHINWPSSLIYDANKGTNTVTIEGRGDYYGTVTTKYKIIPKNLSTTTDPSGTADIVVSDGTTKVYDGKIYDISPTITYFVFRATAAGQQDIKVYLTKGSNADYTTDPNSIGADVTDDTVTATVEGQNNYTGSVTSVGYGITKRSLTDTDNITVEGLNDKEYYTGSQIKPEPTVYLTNGETDRSKWIKLKKETDYDVAYGDNVDTSGTVTITGKGNFKDEYNKTFTIEKRSILDDTITIRVEQEKTYNGEVQKPTVELVSKIGSETYYLQETVDYELSYPDDNSNVFVGEGNATTGPRVTIKGIGKYSGETTQGFKITGNLNDSRYFRIVGVDEDYYSISATGTTNLPATCSIYYDDAAHKTIEASSNCTLTQPSTIMPGLQTVTATSTNSLLKGNCEKTVKLKGNLADLTTVEYNKSHGYTGYPVKPEPTKVVYNGREITGTGVYKMVYDDDCTSVGHHNMRIVSNSDYYEDSYDTEGYNITYSLDAADITLDYRTTTYNGKEQKPGVVSVKIGSNTIDPAKYSVSYSTDTTNSGTKTVTITSNSTDITGSKTENYTINPITLTKNNTTITLDQTNWTYTGNEIKPIVTVRCDALAIDNKTLSYGEDYTLAYPDDLISAGNDKVITINAKTDGVANYRGSVTTTYNVARATLNPDEINVSDAIYAGGYQVLPTITGTFNGKELDATTDLEIVSNISDNEWGVGTATIKIKGKGNFAETPVITKTYNVVEADLNDAIIELDKNSTGYTGNDLTDYATNNMVVKIDSGGGNFVPLKLGKHYTLEFNDGEPMTDVGQYKVRITAAPNSNYTGSVYNPQKYYYTVTEKSIADENEVEVKLNQDQWDYTGEPIYPTVTVYDKTKGQYLTKDTDYTVEYKDNVKAGTGTVTVSGKGDYTGAVNKTFHIGHEFNADISLDTTKFVYDGPDSKHEPGATVTQGGKTLVKDRDYEIEYKNKNDDGSYSELDGNAGTKVAKITGIGNYYGQSKEKEYLVVAKTANASKIRIVPEGLEYDKSTGRYYAVYTGDEIKPTVTVYDDEISQSVPVDTVNYYVSYANNKDISKGGNFAKVYVNWEDRGTKSNYTTGSNAYTLEFEIRSKEVTPTDFEAEIVDETPGQNKIYAYTGNEVYPRVSVRDRALDKYLVEGTDYVLSYKNNVNAGTGYVTVTGINNYGGSVDLDFTIQAKMEDAVAPIGDQLYTGQPITPKFTVTCGGNTLVEHVDYEVTYDTDNETYGIAKIDTISPYYDGSKEVPYKIVFDPSLLTVSGYQPSYTYTGQPIKSGGVFEFVVKAPDGTVIPHDDNAITYMNSSTGAGDTTSIGRITATIPVTVGTKTVFVKAEYDITSRTIANCDIARLEDNVYTGKALTPPVYIRDENKNLLRENVDYTLSYSNNINPGVGTVIITGKGEYEGQTSRTFNIIAPKVLGLTGTVGSDSSVTLSWLKNAHVTGYDIYSQDGSKKYGSTTANTFTISKAKAGNESVFKVRAYVTVNGKRTDGEFAECTVYTGLTKPVVTINSYARKRATLNWNASANVSGYEIYRSNSANGEFRKIAVMPATSGGYSDSGLTSGQTYYYKVRAYQKTAENTFVYGHFSDVKSIVVK